MSLALKRRKPIRFGRVILYLLLIGSSLIMVYPFVVMISTSLGTLQDYYDNPGLPIPQHFTLENYQLLLDPTKTAGWGGTGSLYQMIFNTLFRIIWYLFITGFTSVLGGYALSKLRWRGREGVFTYLLSSMVLPGIVYLIPTYIMIVRWPLVGGNDILGQGGTGFLNTWGSLLIIGWVNAYYIFMFRQILAGIPMDFEEAARVDGANTFQCLVQIYLPMMKPVFVVLFINTFVGYWNDYLWPLMVVSGNGALMPIGLGFQYITLQAGITKNVPLDVKDYPFMFAVGVITITPCILLYMILQRYFIEGVQGFAIKG